MKATKQYIRESLKDVFPSEEIQAFENIIFEAIMGYTRIQLHLHADDILPQDKVEKIYAIVRRLKTAEPIQYILGETEFYDRIFHVAPGVLIPRPETEELIHWILHTSLVPSPSILDIGTGSGCIPISLDLELPQAKVKSFDVSDEALIIAQKNILKLDAKVTLQKVDILAWENYEIKEAFDVIVSNPPYVTMTEKQEIQENVLAHEPHLALFVEDHDPLLFYRRIGEFAQQKLKAQGYLFFEINQYLGNETVKLLEDQGFVDIELRKDISGNDRMIRCQKK